MSPPAWGWPELAAATSEEQYDVPTRVGMARASAVYGVLTHGCPHPRGDGPLSYSVKTSDEAMSPPAWGWPGTSQIDSGLDIDVPTRVGMARGNLHAGRC